MDLHHIWQTMRSLQVLNLLRKYKTIVSRRLSPFETGVITIGSFDGKGQFNVIKDAVELEGDVRALTDDTRDTIEN